MADFTISVEGAERLAGKFREAARSSPGEFDKTQGKWARSTAGVLRRKGYPPQRPGQTYVRTRRLKRGFEAQRQRSLEWSITNVAQHRGKFYAGYVIGDQQAWMHAGRWWKMRTEIEKELPKLTKALEQDISRLLF